MVLLAPTFFKSSLPEWWPGKPLKLGLDLRGGSYIVLSVDTPEAVKSHLTAMAGAIRADLKKKGVAVMRAKQVGDKEIEFRVLKAEALGQLDSYIREKYRDLIKKPLDSSDTSLRALYTISPEQIEQIEKQAVDQAIETVRNRVDQYGVAEPVIQRSGLKRIIVQLPDVTDLETVKETIGKVAKLEFRLVDDPVKASGDYVELKSRAGGEERVEEEVLMSGDAIDSAIVDINPQTSEIGVELKFNSIGAETFDRITSENENRQLAIVLDGVVQSSPVIRERISGGVASISGGFSKEEAHQLAVVLRSGALPAPLLIEEQRTVGASLGADSIHRGILASALGALLVILFMLFYYKKSGAQAVVCTVLNILFLLTLLTLFGTTLTLPGIAGLALTIGMAVDSNVIIFERVKEELKKGAKARAAIDAAFHKAHWTILDANITTLLSGIILYAFGTGPIKGFAVSLSLGIITTVFAALFISKLSFELVNHEDAEGRLSI